jgi:hypothetical protein
MTYRLLFLAALIAATPLTAQVLDPKLHHLRSGDAREWDDFPAQAESRDLVVRFDSRPNPTEFTLRLRHRDIKQTWVITLNGKELAKLPLDENAMVTYWPIPAGSLRDGVNDLRIAATTPDPSDDIEVGEIQLLNLPRQKLLSQATVDVQILDADHNTPLPSRLTLADDRGALIMLANTSDAQTAVRPGVVYTAGGKARLQLPAGRYTLYAGRGFAYSLDRATLDLHPGDAVEKTLRIRRVVPLDGYLSCDTHIHTVTFSRHGDATLAERMITLAGEDVQLPVATDHNLQIDYEDPAKDANVRAYFTPVIGNELTTASIGHFNIFPIPRSAKLLNWRAPTWQAITRNIAETLPNADPIIILNHARDTHGNFRPFDPSRHLSYVGEDLDGWPLPANTMEVINSGATQTDPMQLYRDWFGMLNAGHTLTPVGASDSHDVSRYIVGQARTYIRCDAPDPAHIDVAQAVAAFRQGRVLISYGLIADLTVAGRYHPGDLVPAPDGELPVTVRVLGPEWTRPTHVTLYANGEPIRETDIAPRTPEPAGVKWEQTWRLPKPPHDLYLVAIASGPGIKDPYWPTAKPYQPMSLSSRTWVIGSSGAVRIDANNSSRFDSPRDVANQIIERANGTLPAVIAALDGCDAPTAAQAALLLHRRHPEGFDQSARAAIERASPPIRHGFEIYLAEKDKTN